MENARRIVRIALAVGLAASLGCEKREPAGGGGGGAGAGGGGGAGAGGAGGAGAAAGAPDGQAEVCGPAMKAKEDAEWAEKTKAERAPKQKKVDEARVALEAALNDPLRAGRAPDRGKLQPLVAALHDARRELGTEPGGDDPIVKAAELVERAQICRAVQADDPAICAKLGQSAGTCRGRIVQLRRLGATMIGRKRCDQTVADAAAKLEKARSGAPLVALCEAAVTGSADKCGALDEAPLQALCSTLATGDAAACAKLDEKQRASCLADAALVAAASGGVAKAPAADLPAGAKVLVDAAIGTAGKTACVDEASRQWHDYLATLN